MHKLTPLFEYGRSDKCPWCLMHPGGCVKKETS